MINNDVKESLKLELKKHLSELMDMDIEDINDNVDLLELGATSMIIVQLYVILQEQFGISLDSALDLHKSISINSIIDDIEQSESSLEL